MDDLVKSLKAQLYDRVTSPLLSSFLIAWVAWNHRLFVVLFFSDFKVEKKFEYVDERLFPHWQDVLGRGFAWPLLSALFILLIYPYPSRWIYERVRADQKRLKEIQQRIEDETPMTIAEARELRTAMRKAEEIVDAKDKIIAALRNTITAQETTIADQESRLKNVPITPTDTSSAELQLNHRQRNILAAIARHRGIKLATLQLSSSASNIEVEHEVDQLIDANLIEEISGMDQAFQLSSEGRAYLVKQGRNLLEKYDGVSINQIIIDD